MPDRCDKDDYERYLNLVTETQDQPDLIVYMHWTWKEPNPKTYMKIFRNPKWISIQTILETYKIKGESDFVYFSINSENGL